MEHMGYDSIMLVFGALEDVLFFSQHSSLKPRTCQADTAGRKAGRRNNSATHGKMESNPIVTIFGEETSINQRLFWVPTQSPWVLTHSQIAIWNQRISGDVLRNGPQQNLETPRRLET